GLETAAGHRPPVLRPVPVGHADQLPGLRGLRPPGPGPAPGRVPGHLRRQRGDLPPGRGPAPPPRPSPGAPGAAAPRRGRVSDRPPRLAYAPALDGLRAVACLSVMLYHAKYLHGGFLGVDIFFTLSGFLITS